MEDKHGEMNSSATQARSPKTRHTAVFNRHGSPKRLSAVAAVPSQAEVGYCNQLDF